MKAFRFSILTLVFGILLSTEGQTQTNPVTKYPTGIEIVPKLKKPKLVRKFDEKNLCGYLLVYFKDQNQCAYMAISRDGYIFTDVNNGNPVFDGSILAEQKGVRDPHITRGPDGAFYLVMTDLHIFGQRAGYRTTQWQRPQEKHLGLVY